MLLRIFY